jgi:hypothetical protein
MKIFLWIIIVVLTFIGNFTTNTYAIEELAVLGQGTSIKFCGHRAIVSLL